MSANFYDAVLIGPGLHTLLAGGLLAKRGFRVLLLGQDTPSPSYHLGDLTLPRGPFTLTAASSPAVGRVFAELALKPLLRRITRPLDPAFQVVVPGHRLSFSTDHEHMAREVDRELPAVRRATDDYGRAVAHSWAAIDRLMERDLMWPPDTFLERRQLSRAALHQPFGRGAVGEGPLGELPDAHPFRDMVSVTSRFADGSSLGDGNAQRQMRLYGAWLRGEQIDGGLAALWDLLLENIRTHNGSVHLDRGAERILMKRGAISGVRLSTSGEEIGCHFVLSGLPAVRLARLLSDRTPLDTFIDEVGQPRPKLFRYTLNLVVPADAVPEGMGRDLFLVGEHRDGVTDQLWIQTSSPDAHGRRVMSVQALIPRHKLDNDPDLLTAMRERVVERLRELAPFLPGQVLVMDSPHDGRNVDDMARGELEAPDPWRRGADTMPVLYAYPRTRLHGCCGLPCRTSVKRLLLCNDQVTPGLGTEGLFLTAWSAARVVARSLGRDWMNRGRWTKVEL